VEGLQTYQNYKRLATVIIKQPNNCKASQNNVIDWRKNKTFLVQSIHEHLQSVGIDGYFASNASSLGRGFKLSK